MLKLYITGLLFLALLFCPIIVQAEAYQKLSINQKISIKKYTQLHFKGQWQEWVRVIEAMAFVESHNGAEKIGKYKSGRESNCYGLLQLKPSTARDMMKELNIPDTYDDFELITKLIYDDDFNIHLSVAYMKFLFKLFNDADLSITSYNIGQGKVIKILRAGKRLPKEYLEKVKGKNWWKLPALAGDS